MQYAINSYSFLFVVTDMDFSKKKKKKNFSRQHINEGSVSFLMLHVTCIFHIKMAALKRACALLFFFLAPLHLLFALPAFALCQLLLFLLW